MMSTITAEVGIYEQIKEQVRAEIARIRKAALKTAKSAWNTAKRWASKAAQVLKSATVVLSDTYIVAAWWVVPKITSLAQRATRITKAVLTTTLALLPLGIMCLGVELALRLITAHVPVLGEIIGALTLGFLGYQFVRWSVRKCFRFFNYLSDLSYDRRYAEADEAVLNQYDIGDYQIDDYEAVEIADAVVDADLARKQKIYLADHEALVADFDWVGTLYSTSDEFVATLYDDARESAHALGLSEHEMYWRARAATRRWIAKKNPKAAQDLIFEHGNEFEKALVDGFDDEYSVDTEYCQRFLHSANA